MKSILVQDCKVYICEEIVANGKANVDVPYYFNLEVLINATKKRMEHCVTQLQEAYSKQKVFKVGDCVIEYEGGWFNIPSYEAMKDSLKFSYVSYTEWSIGASVIEEIEMYKLQLQARGEDK